MRSCIINFHSFAIYIFIGRLKSELFALEKQIFELEGNYIEETRDFGNILSGWDQFLSLEKGKIRKAVTTEERLFSLTSSTSTASRNLKKVV